MVESPRLLMRARTSSLESTSPLRAYIVASLQTLPSDVQCEVQLPCTSPTDHSALAAGSARRIINVVNESRLRSQQLPRRRQLLRVAVGRLSMAAIMSDNVFDGSLQWHSSLSLCCGARFCLLIVWFVKIAEIRLNNIVVLHPHPLSMQCVAQLLSRAVIVHAAVAPGRLHAAHRSTAASARTREQPTSVRAFRRADDTAPANGMSQDEGSAQDQGQGVDFQGVDFQGVGLEKPALVSYTSSAINGH